MFRYFSTSKILVASSVSNVYYDVIVTRIIFSSPFRHYVLRYVNNRRAGGTLCGRVVRYSPRPEGLLVCRHFSRIPLPHPEGRFFRLHSADKSIFTNTRILRRGVLRISAAPLNRIVSNEASVYM